MSTVAVATISAISKDALRVLKGLAALFPLYGLHWLGEKFLDQSMAFTVFSFGLGAVLLGCILLIRSGHFQTKTEERKLQHCQSVVDRYQLVGTALVVVGLLSIATGSSGANYLHRQQAAAACR